MARLLSRFSAGAAFVAALSMAATPVAAAGLPDAPRAPFAARAHAPSAPGAQTLDWHGRRHRDRIDAGDVFAGLLILGGIAAIASAASSDKRDSRPYEEQPYPYPDDRPDYREQRSTYGGGIDNAVDICVGEVERGDTRVASVDNAARTADGWRISGQLNAGADFSCWIDNDGRIRNIDMGGSDWQGGSYDGPPAADNQYDDETYARARAQAGYPDPYGPDDHEGGSPDDTYGDYDASGG